MRRSIFTSLYDHRTAIFAAIFVLAVFALPFSAQANDVSADDSVPWEGSLKGLVEVISGPTALYISMIGLFFAGGILIFGGELGNFTRMIMMVVLVGSTLTGISNLVLKFVNSGCVLL